MHQQLTGQKKEQTFIRLNQTLPHDAVVSQPSLNQTVVVETDVTVFLQECANDIQSASFMSRVLAEVEIKKNMQEWVCLADMSAVE